jgi:hypothetical protein
MMSITNQATVYQPEHELWEYLLVAYPDENVNEKIADEKRSFYEEYVGVDIIKSKSCITIVNFIAKERMEETLIRWIQNICNLQSSFSVTFNNFSGFPPHTIYLRVLDHQPFNQLANQLKIIDGFIQDNDCPPIQLARLPYLTIAGSLTETVYDEAIQSYAHRSFNESCKVEKLVLVRRSTVYNEFQLVNTFALAQDQALYN